MMNCCVENKLNEEMNILKRQDEKYIMINGNKRTHQHSAECRYSPFVDKFAVNKPSDHIQNN